MSVYQTRRKFSRGVIRATHLGEGDLSALENPNAVEEIRRNIYLSLAIIYLTQ